VGGRLLLRLNTDERPIANKYLRKDEKNFEKRVKILEIAVEEAMSSALLQVELLVRQWGSL